MSEVIEDVTSLGRMLELMERDGRQEHPSAPPFCAVHPDVTQWLYDHLKESDPIPLEDMFSAQTLCKSWEIANPTWWHFSYANVLLDTLWHHQENRIPWSMNIKVAGWLMDFIFNPSITSSAYDWMEENGNKPWNA
jgi:hypothetical protein